MTPIIPGSQIPDLWLRGWPEPKPIIAGSRVRPKSEPYHDPYCDWRWTGTVERTEGDKALVGITDIPLEPDPVRRCDPPILAWVGLQNLEQA